jgi:hypothetical protein
MNEVVEKKENTLVTKEDMEFLVWFDEQKKRAKVIEDRIKNEAHQFLRDNGLQEDGFKQEVDGATVHIYETKPYTKKQCDIKRMKEEGVYDLYTHDVQVKGSIRIQVEYD